MAVVAARLLLLLAVAGALALPAAGEIKTESFREDPRPSIMFEKFGFSQSGAVRIVVSGAAVSSSFARADPKKLGFFLLSDESLVHAIYESQEGPTPEKRAAAAGGDDPDAAASGCVLSSPYVKKLFTFHDMEGGHYNKSFPVTHPDEYTLFFANCAPQSLVTMRVRTEMYNVNADGSKDYLPVGQAPVPAIYGFFAFCYAAFLASWGYLTLSRDRISAHQIHHLMSGLLVARLLYCLSAAEDQHYIRVTGTPHGWDVAFYLFQLVKGVILFAVIALVGTGWSFLKPVLQDREKKVLMAVIPLQVTANIAAAVIGETGPFLQGWVTWNQILLFVDVACCCAVLFPVVWSIRSLRETSKTDGKAARNLSKLTLFRQFYVVVIGYLYFTRIVVYALKTIASYKYRWVSILAEEVATMAFYLFMFYTFRPAEESKYFSLDDDEEEAAEMVLRVEEFEL
ncbi:protein CANDIDATE G-PROTEIN COUPLED RECEPTOR 7-like [Phragmites australis]|uniref:protein CANDIDATE G-PROTEIN COUPLED RECEPTOR 7-like n=1 Tax=Phragmites australis TaxID=29695 RepID=UPI002D76ACC9|nr:protein CANDIDATE G-PROTEIN COUPLED RECEPTOR 7-like [Phragmites australis]